MQINNFWNPFGKEYAWSPRWRFLERYYIRIFGIVDLPSRLRARLVIRAVRKFQGNTLLDFGCGAGIYAFYFSRWPSVQVRGVDIDNARITDCKVIAKKIGRDNVRFYEGNSHDWLQRFDSMSFDQVLIIEALQCFADANLVLFETHRILRPGGILIGHVPVLGYLRKFERTLFDDKKLRQLLKESGFEIVSLTPTFGRITQQLCHVFEQITHFKMIVALLFPFLLLISFAFKIESSNGNSRLFVARKPIIESDIP
jgi:ubiquinone/menaquinone biosynthesis C-methylase UbiE